MPVLRSAYGKPLLDVDACIRLLASFGPAALHSSSSTCVCADCLRSVSFSVSHHGDWLLLVGQRACGGCHCRSDCARCTVAAVREDGASEDIRSSSSVSDGVRARCLLGCDVTTTDLPLRHATKYERAWPTEEIFTPPRLAATGCDWLFNGGSSSVCGYTSHHHSAAAVNAFVDSAAVLSDYLGMFASELHDDERSMLASCTLPSPHEVRPRRDERAAAVVRPSAHCLTAFAVLWSVKEAVVKAVGLGLSIRLSSLRTTLTYSDGAQHSPYEAAVAVCCVRPGGVGCVATAPPHCSAGSVDCCRALDWHWEVQLLPLDERHTAAIARAAPTLQQLQHENEHAASCTVDTHSMLNALGSGSAHILSPSLRVLSVEELLAAAGLTIQSLSSCCECAVLVLVPYMGGSTSNNSHMDTRQHRILRVPSSRTATDDADKDHCSIRVNRITPLPPQLNSIT